MLLTYVVATFCVLTIFAIAWPRLRYGRLHNFDLRNPETGRVVFSVTENVAIEAPVQEAVVIPAGTFVQTAEGGAYPIYRCNCCGATLALNRDQMRSLPSSLARGCRPLL